MGTFAGGMLSYFMKWNEAFLVFGTQFAGGVFLGTTLMHFLSDSNETFGDLTEKEYPFAFMLASAGYLLTMWADCIVSYVYGKGSANNDVELQGHAHDETVNNNELSAGSKSQTLTSTGTKKGELFLADVNTQLKNKNITIDIKVDTNSNWTLLQLFTTVTIDEPTPRLKTILSFRVPDQRSGNLEFQYLHEFAGISSSVGLTANPIVNFSGVVGTNKVALGGDVSFDTKEGAYERNEEGVYIEVV